MPPSSAFKWFRETPEDPRCRVPQRIDACLWRYMDLSKLISLLDTKTLHFTSIANFEDSHEGRYSISAEADIASQAAFARESGNDVKAVQLDRDFDAVVRHHRDQRHHFYVNCWHLNKCESMAMWQVYAGRHSGIAVRSTFRKLAEALPDQCRVGMVEYSDGPRPFANTNGLCMRKRIAYTFENEVRAVIVYSTINYWDARRALQQGIRREVDVTRLVDAIVLAPQSGALLKESVQAVLQRFAPDLPLQQSSIDEPPIGGESSILQRLREQ